MASSVILCWKHSQLVSYRLWKIILLNSCYLVKKFQQPSQDRVWTNVATSLISLKNSTCYFYSWTLLVCINFIFVYNSYNLWVWTFFKIKFIDFVINVRWNILCNIRMFFTRQNKLFMKNLLLWSKQQR